MRNQKAQIENAANTTKTFFSDQDGNGLYEVRFAYKQEMGPGCGFTVKEGTCTLEACSKAEALEIFESLPARKNLKIGGTKIRRIQNGIIWNMNA